MTEPNHKHITLETLAVFFWFMLDGCWLMEWRWETYLFSVLSISVFVIALCYVRGESVVWFVALADLCWLLCNVAWAIGDLEKWPLAVLIAKWLFLAGLICCAFAFLSSGKLDIVLRRMRLLNWLQK